ncbi:MAG: adenylate/guanylate cyclase domain-containing protein [Pirellulaceae bacterium]
MADLIAQGTEPRNRWRHRLPENQVLVLGRRGNRWATPWDSHVSSEHVEICWRHGRLHVQQMDSTRNPVFFHGRKEDQFQVVAGEHFVIGSTSFSVSDEQIELSINEPLPATEKTFSAKDLQASRYHDAEQQIDLLSDLPRIISSSGTNGVLFSQLIGLLLRGIARADGVALVKSSRLSEDPDAETIIEVMQWDSRSGAASDIRPSQRIIQQATDAQKSVAYVWEGKRTENLPTLTASADIDWAFCTPINSPACPEWAIYVEGQFEQQASSAPESYHPQALHDDMKFTELIASSLGDSLHLSKLKRDQAVFGQFFPTVVLDALGTQDPEQFLAPREVTLSVLFCDVRGFSRTSELASNDLLELLERVSQALSVMTRHILDQGGVVGDFHGDSAMGFWGWPGEPANATRQACLAALEIQRDFRQAAQDPTHPLHDFRIGIGIASGKAVAGKLGSLDQVKVTAFGPVVNLAARLETMTKVIGASILIDDVTATAVRGTDNLQQAMRFRQVGQIQPFGLETNLLITELLPPLADSGAVSPENIDAYEQAWQQFQAGSWSTALQALDQLPDSDPVKPWLQQYIQVHGPEAPQAWNGTIVMTHK